MARLHLDSPIEGLPKCNLAGNTFPRAPLFHKAERKDKNLMLYEIFFEKGRR